MNAVVLRGLISNLAPQTQVGPTDPRGLQNNFARPLRIDEIRIRTPSTGSAVDQPSAYASGSIQIRLGNVPITAGFVPVPAVTWPHVDYSAESPWAITAVPRPTFAGRYMRFSKPVYLMPKQFLSFQYVYQTVGWLTGNADVEVLAMCREVDDVRSGYTPWICSYLPPGRTEGTGNFVDVSTSVDLVNPFDDDLEVERLIGRVLYSPFAAAGVTGALTEEYFSVGPGLHVSTDQIRVRMEDHHATQIVRDSAPFKHVFDIIHRSWAINTVLPAKGFYQVVIESNLTTAVGGPLVLQPFVGMLGYRKVR
jgi:hypothetical protein